jgi:uncharacterized membrane protein
MPVDTAVVAVIAVEVAMIVFEVALGNTTVDSEHCASK